jgi:lysophospholipid acyltransferase (LPLAT)-like uncharacterized protein
VVSIFYRLLSLTWRYEILDYDSLVEKNLKLSKPVILAHWHEDEWALIGFFRNKAMNVLVSHSKDGRAMTLFLKAMGYKVARGSSSRGGVRGLLEFLKNVKKSSRPLMSFAVDGPKGPRRIPKQGVVFAADKMGVPVYVMAAFADRCWIFKGSWSRAYLPKPFARITISFGQCQPLADSSAYDLAAAEVTRALDAAKGLAKQTIISHSNTR